AGSAILHIEKKLQAPTQPGSGVYSLGVSDGLREMAGGPMRLGLMTYGLCAALCVAWMGCGDDSSSGGGAGTGGGGSGNGGSGNGGAGNTGNGGSGTGNVGNTFS